MQVFGQLRPYVSPGIFTKSLLTQYDTSFSVNYTVFTLELNLQEKERMTLVVSVVLHVL
jgi:hypothetical protein